MPKISRFKKAKGVKSRSHGCARCGTHRGKMHPFQRKSGRKYTLCDGCKPKG